MSRPRTSVRARDVQLGLSLVELMIALLIGSILMLGLIQVFAASRAAYRISEGMSRVQENGRFAMDYLQRDIRMIGHFGCVNDQSHKLQVDALRMQTGAAVGTALDFNLSVQGFEANGTQPGQTVSLAGPTGGWTPALPAHITALNPAPLAGSDVIMLRYFRPNSAPVTGITVAGTTTTISTTAGGWADLTQDGIASPTVFGIADCSFADVVTGTGNAAAATVTVPVAIDRYTPSPAGHAALYRAEAVAYYVANPPGRTRPSLYRARWNSAGVATTEELVEGIENLQLLYGQDRSANVANPSGYIESQNVASDAALGVATTAAGEQNWRRVGLVQIGIMSSSPDIMQTQQALASPISLGVRFTAPNDSRLRAAYETTVALRNRLYGN